MKNKHAPAKQTAVRAPAKPKPKPISKPGRSKPRKPTKRRKNR